MIASLRICLQDCLPKWQLAERKWENRSVWWKVRLEAEVGSWRCPLAKVLPAMGTPGGQRYGGTDYLWEGTRPALPFLLFRSHQLLISHPESLAWFVCTGHRLLVGGALCSQDCC